ncbi:MAG: class I SAM-dependent methyltransferase [Anaerolineae bacterium]|nr:class I SAM-dependent methyltransferase [Anaerolineae bacterium]
MPGDYAVLAPIYDAIGMAEFGQRITPRLIDYAQRIDWLGRRIAVLGCGTGSSIEYLSQYPYNLIGVDNSAEMLDAARRKMNDPGLSLKWLQADIRELGTQIGSVDLALALNVMNELNSLRDLETVFGNVQRSLEPGKLFLFDMLTVQGLTQDGESGDRLLHNDPQNLTVFSTTDYDYERQMQTTQYFIFQRAGNGWERSEAKRILRAFPVQAIASLLQRSGFTLRTILNSNLESYDHGSSRAPRVIFVAEKPSSN